MGPSNPQFRVDNSNPWSVQAVMPASVYLVGMVLGVENWHLGTAVNMAVIIAGVAIASYGEVTKRSAHLSYQQPPCGVVWWRGSILDATSTASDSTAAGGRHMFTACWLSVAAELGSDTMRPCTCIVHNLPSAMPCAGELRADRAVGADCCECSGGNPLVAGAGELSWNST